MTSDLHPSHFTLGFKQPHFMLSVLARGSQQDHVICKKKKRNPLVPKPDPLRTEILSIKVMNRTGDKGQSCWSPTCTGNRSDLVPAIRTKLLLCLYINRVAPNKGSLSLYSWSNPHRAPRRTHSFCGLLQVHKTHVDRLGKLP
ncbi:hypothetical protein ILYODFUR_027479 [Ilyodon furcidens]|uniref:Uncharacterized protein n=1 Tax=Ilyodon furcidens TaxID=33524 RepID=A0ABV0VHR6_9TELE